MKINHVKKTIASLAASALMAANALPAFAAPPGAQVFNVYDNTQDGLVVLDDPDVGNVQVVANPGGQSRLIINIHLQKVAPNCELTVELVRDSQVSNGGLDSSGHTGLVDVLGTITTNRVGNGNVHYDIDPTTLFWSSDVTPGELDTTVYGHLDFEVYSGTCVKSDGTSVGFNEYGAAPDPLLSIPLTWME
jgi:hypothetical protein